MSEYKPSLLVISNHPVDSWSNSLKEDWKDIEYVEFPAVPANAASEDVLKMAQKLLVDNFNTINKFANVNIQGEFSLTISFIMLVRRNPLLQHVAFWVPTAEREVVENKAPDGTTIKTSVFKFVQWRQII